MSNEMISSIRKEIDKVDDIIIDNLVKRVNLVLEIVKYKKNEEEVKGTDRVRQVLEKVREKARVMGGNEDVVVAIYKGIIEILTNLQMNILKEK